MVLEQKVPSLSLLPLKRGLLARPVVIIIQEDFTTRP
jgi:hypothetical protein